MATLSKEITDRYRMNGISIYQPDKDMSYNFDTTYAESTQRTQNGKIIITPLFTVEQYGYEATNIPIEEANKLLRIIIKGNAFELYHFSIYHMEWRTDQFYVAKGQHNIGSLSPDRRFLSKLSFNMTGVNPLD